ncbi:MAG TPA: serine/threonine-protein kinase [Planctomycetota bacterium]|nr:serine/threonine-protein kinase [Planctomycetota bacterium]
MTSSDSDHWFESFRAGLQRDEAERTGTEPAVPSLPNELPDVPRYTIGERIGEGSAAVVYRGWDRELGRPVALKVLRDTADVRRSLRLRFHREAKIAAGLNHPNIVRIYDLGEVEGRLFMVMELVEGSSLGSLISDQAIPLDDKLRLLEKAARGVAQAHAQGIIHRDLKPANILVDRAREPKVGDFGISLGIEAEPRLTRTGEPLGTPAYMAPEQVRGSGDPTVRTDVYALGAILYEMLTGRPPHLASTIPELYQKILEGEPELPHVLASGSPRAAGAVALRGLSRNPADRYADAGEFAEDLARYLRGEPVHARNPGPVRRIGIRLRGRPLAGTLLLGAVAFGLIAAAAALSRKTVDIHRSVLLSAVARMFDQEKGRLDERYKGLQPVRLIAALQAASGHGPDTTPPEEIRELLNYELKKLRVEPELLALMPLRGKAVYGRGPAAALASLENLPPGAGLSYTAVDGRLWLLEGAEVRDTAPEHEDVVHGYRWIGAPIDSAALPGMIDAEAGLVAWIGPDRQVLASSGTVDKDSLQREIATIDGRSLRVSSEPLSGALVPIRQALLVHAHGVREFTILAATLAGAILLGAGIVLLARPR